MKKKLPYPSGKVEDMPTWVEDALRPLRSRLDALNAERDEIIAAEYISTQRRGDIENVLFYNVRKNTSFKKSSRHGLRFRYLAEEPILPPEFFDYFSHYQSYELVKKDAPFQHGHQSVASYEFSSSKPELEYVWWDSMEAKWSLNSGWKQKIKKGEMLKDFVLCVDMQHPKGLDGQYAMRYVKEVFDGIASAMHFWKNPHGELVRKVVSHLKVSSKSVRKKFQTNEHALLGERHPSQNWNPADDRCVAGELLLCPGEGDEWRFKVEILSVE